VAVTQWTAPAIVGLKSGAKYLQLVRDWRIPHTRIGQDVIVELSVLLRFIREHAADIETPTEELAPVDAEARICQQLGLRRVV
jgi:hypothetical protein